MCLNMPNLERAKEASLPASLNSSCMHRCVNFYAMHNREMLTVADKEYPSVILKIVDFVECCVDGANESVYCQRLTTSSKNGDEALSPHQWKTRVTINYLSARQAFQNADGTPR